MEQDRFIKRRAQREDVALKHKALAIAAPIGREIGLWQEAVTRLGFVVTRPKCSPESRHRATAILRALSTLVAERQGRLEALSRELPDKLATSSWLGDIQQGLVSLQRRLKTFEAGSVVARPIGQTQPRSAGTDGKGPNG